MTDEPTITVPLALFQAMYNTLALDGQRSQMMAQAADVLQRAAERQAPPKPRAVGKE